MYQSTIGMLGSRHKCGTQVSSSRTPDVPVGYVVGCGSSPSRIALQTATHSLQIYAWKGHWEGFEMSTRTSSAPLLQYEHRGSSSPEWLLRTVKVVCMEAGMTPLAAGPPGGKPTGSLSRAQGARPGSEEEANLLWRNEYKPA